ncbi:YHYH domain-containing protein [Bathymodiolus thermophilus thioautotrophic gill symbiont]|uniref:YHYH domain-containing protein n=1 Tax=Bathymodiolus thermophilus thioautotrophic gill symbiont TaxID=2360 RepID=UPI001F5244D5|nr:YHYH domain-containing protein [Bathymodiolus thermophilus thioautotrophic gill symbiont]
MIKITENKGAIIKIQNIMAITLLSISLTIRAHSGGLNARGCHHETRTGGYHCHNNSDSGSGPSLDPSLRKLIGTIALLGAVYYTYYAIGRQNLHIVLAPIGRNNTTIYAPNITIEYNF